MLHHDSTTTSDRLLGTNFASETTLFDGELDSLSTTLFDVDKERNDQSGEDTEDKEEDEGVAIVSAALDDGGADVGADKRGCTVGDTAVRSACVCEVQ